MIRWMALGTFVTVGSALLWGLCAQGFDSTWAKLLVGVPGIIASAWLVPLWWLVNLVLHSISSSLRFVAGSLLRDEQDAELYFTEIRERGASWVVVATEWGLERYDAPPLVQAAVPEVVEYVSPLLDTPLEEGLESMRQDTIVRLSTWRRRTEWVRTVWALLCFVPLWGGCLILAWIAY